MRFISTLLILFLFTSCATLLNRKTCEVTLSANPAGTKIIYNDSAYTAPITLRVMRSKKPLNVTSVYDSICKNFTIRPALNGMFLYGNLAGLPAPVGYLIDLTNPKRFCYGKYNTLDLLDTVGVILPEDLKYYRNRFHDAYDKIEKGQYKNTFKFGPFNLADFYIPSLQISYERLLRKKLSAQFELGYVIPIVHNSQKGFKLRTEIREYLNYRKYGASYFAFEIYYTNTDYWYEGYFHAPADTFSENGYNDNVKISKQLYGFNMKFGRQYGFGHFVFEWYLGIGAKYRDVKESDRENPNDIHDMPKDFNFWYAGNSPERNWVVNFPINIKIGYRF
jgi:hypothetical protein